MSDVTRFLGPEENPTEKYGELDESTESIPLPSAGHILTGRCHYRLLRPIGSGGYGAVYEASVLDGMTADGETLPPIVAIKIYKAPREEFNEPLMKRELSSLRALSHPLIPRVYDWKVDGSTAFVVMHYYPQGSLADRQKRSDPMDVPTCWRLLIDLLTALNEAHRASLLHLDIKPGNVLIADDGSFVLSDFGISQGLMVSWKLVTPSLGTRGFQSPEQRGLEEESIDARTDLWGVGATMWSLATGVQLGGNPNLAKMIRQDPEHGLPPIQEYRRELPDNLAEVIMSLLKRDPRQRPGGAAEVLARIAGARDISGDSRIVSKPETGMPVSDEEVSALLGRLLDPLWVSVCSAPRLRSSYMKFPAGVEIVREGSKSYHALLLLSGAVQVTRQGEVIARDEREGTFIGEVSTLTGRHRTASVVAETDVVMCCFNASEFERMLAMNPAIAIRLVKTLADRLVAERESRAADEV